MTARVSSLSLRPFCPQSGLFAMVDEGGWESDPRRATAGEAVLCSCGRWLTAASFGITPRHYSEVQR
jgi:hypothetical protein